MTHRPYSPRRRAAIWAGLTLACWIVPIAIALLIADLLAWCFA